jgi:hypothetical protein
MFHAGSLFRNHVLCRILHRILFHAGFIQKINFHAGSHFNKSFVQFPYRIFIQKNMFCARSHSRKTHPIKDLSLKENISETVFSQRISNLKRKKIGEWSSTEG